MPASLYDEAMADMTNARQALRAGTAPYHDRVDAIFARTDFTDRAAYGRFLQAQAAAHIAAEDALDAAGASAVLPDWPTRRRAALLRADLAALGLDAPATCESLDLAQDAAILGGVYVLEGSRLGGTLLKRSVPAEFPATFLGAADPPAWRSLLATLDARLRTAEDVRIAIDAAARVFLLFEASGRRFSEVCR